MLNSRYGLKEVANVIFFDLETSKPVLFFDTLKVSTIENESESAEARGGQGNNKLIHWDYGRTANLTMQDALLSDTSLAMLAGSTVQRADIKIVGREVLTVKEDMTVTLAQTDVSKITSFKVVNGVMDAEVVGATANGAIVTLTGVEEDDRVMVFYEYTQATGASKVTFSGSKFPSTYRVVGNTVVRGEDGIDRMMQFNIPKASLQSSFSLTMDAENVSTFDFNLEILVETGTQALYDIIRIN